MLRLRVLLPAVLIVGVLAAPAGAAVPNPGMSVVPNVVMTPSGGLEYIVQVNDAVGAPCPGIIVTLNFVSAGLANSMLCFCVDQPHPIVTAMTDGVGEAHFFIHGGGCLNPGVGDPTVDVSAAGVFLATVGVVSPDVVDRHGVRPSQNWQPGTHCACTTSDLIIHTHAIQTATYDFCSDIDSDGFIQLADAVLIAGAIQIGEACLRQ